MTEQEAFKEALDTTSTLPTETRKKAEPVSGMCLGKSPKLESAALASKECKR